MKLKYNRIYSLNNRDPFNKVKILNKYTNNIVIKYLSIYSVILVINFEYFSLNIPT